MYCEAFVHGTVVESLFLITNVCLVLGDFHQRVAINSFTYALRIKG